MSIWYFISSGIFSNTCIVYSFVPRCHYLQFPEGVLNRHYEKLVQCDPRLKALVDGTLSGSSPHYDSSDSAFEGQSVLRPKSRSPLTRVFEGYNDQPHSPLSQYSPLQGRMSSSGVIPEMEPEMGSIDMHRNETSSPSSGNYSTLLFLFLVLH